MNSPEGPSFPAGLLSGGASPSGDEGFFPFVLERRDSFLGGGPGPEEPEDLALQLQQKEKDLLLAAELGKMLLERNEELQRQLDTLNTQHAEREEVSWRRGQGWRVEGQGPGGGQREKAGWGVASGTAVQGWDQSPWQCCSVVKNMGSGTTLAVQRLGLCVSNAGMQVPSLIGELKVPEAAHYREKNAVSEGRAGPKFRSLPGCVALGKPLALSEPGSGSSAVLHKPQPTDPGCALAVWLWPKRFPRMIFIHSHSALGDAHGSLCPCCGHPHPGRHIWPPTHPGHH